MAAGRSSIHHIAHVEKIESNRAGLTMKRRGCLRRWQVRCSSGLRDGMRQAKVQKHFNGLAAYELIVRKFSQHTQSPSGRHGTASLPWCLFDHLQPASTRNLGRKSPLPFGFFGLGFVGLVVLMGLVWILGGLAGVYCRDYRAYRFYRAFGVCKLCTVHRVFRV